MIDLLEVTDLKSPEVIRQLVQLLLLFIRNIQYSNGQFKFIVTYTK